MDIVITEKYDGATLLSYLKYTLRISSACITKLKKDVHGLEINGKHVTVRYILKQGDSLHINTLDSERDLNESILPVDIPLDIIYEDDNLLAVNKPPFMPTHPSHNHYDDTLANGVSYLFKSREIPFVFRPIGRLDRNTSGIVILAKNLPSAGHFTRERQNNTLCKSYIAILCGEIDGERGTIDAPIRRMQESIITRTVCDAADEGAADAKTEWELLYRGHNISVVRAYPKTGRTHQLRVHFSYIGHPILGDDLYGEKSEHIDRHALHAYSLSFPLPMSFEEKHLYADIPEDMARAFKEITNDNIFSYIKDTKDE